MLKNNNPVSENKNSYIEYLENSVRRLQNEVSDLREHLALQNTAGIIDNELENINFAFHRIETKEEVLEKLHKIISGRISIIESNIFFFGENDQILAVSEAHSSLSLKDNVKYLEEEGIIDWINTLNEIKVIPNLNLESEDYGSNFILAPLVIRKQTIGIFIASTQMEQSSFSKNILEFVKSVAENAALAMDNIRSKEQIEMMNKKLSNINRQMSKNANLLSLAELTNTISYELSEPLKIMDAHLYMLETGVGSPERRVQVIKEQSKKINSVLNKINEFNVDEDKTKKERHYLNELFDDIYILINSQMRRDGISLNNLTEDKDLKVYCYKNQIEQTFIDIILFQRETMPEGGEIRFKAHNRDKKTYITLSDNGVGIGDEVISQIFEPISDNHDLNKNKLFFVKGIVELHKGKISVASEEGKGTSFKIILPDMK